MITILDENDIFERKEEIFHIFRCFLCGKDVKTLKTMKNHWKRVHYSIFKIIELRRINYERL